MNEMMAAKELTRIAKLVESAGRVLAISDFPDMLKKGLKSIGYNGKDIQVITASSASLSGYAFEGNRKYAASIDMSTGRVDMENGAWGGPTPFNPTKVDALSVKNIKLPVPPNKAVVIGESGGRGNYARMYVNPKSMNLLIDDGEDHDLSEDERKALEIIASIKGGYRQREFERERIGDYSASNPLIQSLEGKDLVKINRKGSIQVTTKGKDVRLQLRGW